ncbi:MAG TPA: universal stress protein [Acidimicrobiales bacterium]|nr:universal stress protein [Acidimicrobiales bacterium]
MAFPAGVRDAVVVGVDGSETGRYALRWAIEEARLRNAELTVVHAWATPTPAVLVGSVVLDGDPTVYEEGAASILDDDVTRVLETTRAPEKGLERRVVQGYAPAVLMTQSSDAGLLVVGSRGQGGFAGLLTGSVSEHCITHPTTPVAVVREDAALPGSSDVVVGVDGSSGSHAALQFAMREAAVRGARLVVVHGWWVGFPGSPRDASPYLEVDRKAIKGRAVAMIQGMLDVARAAAPQTDVEVEVLAMDMAPTTALLKCATEAGLLVVGSRGRGGLAGMLLGSVSRQCVHHAGCAVVVVPSASG